MKDGRIPEDVFYGELTTTFLAEKGFSALVEKRNRLKVVDELMRGALEKQILPQIEKNSSTS